MLLSHNCIAFGIYRNGDTKSNTLLLKTKGKSIRNQEKQKAQ